MITKILELENERRKMLLEILQKAFTGAEVEGLPIPREDKAEGFEIAVRVKDPAARTVLIRPRRALLTDTGANFLQAFLDGIQAARKALADPPLKDVEFQGTVLLGPQGVEKFLKGEKAEPSLE